MSKSSGRGLFGAPRPGAVTLVDTPVSRAYARKARLTFWVVTLIVGLLASVALSHRYSPILGLFGGVAIGALVGLGRRGPGRDVAGAAGAVALGGRDRHGPVPGVRLDRADGRHQPPRLPPRRRRPGGSGRVRSSTPPRHGVGVVCDRAASAAGLLYRSHPVRADRVPDPDRASAVHPDRPADPGRGTGLGVAAHRPGPDRPGRQGREARGRLLGRSGRRRPGHHHLRRPGPHRHRPPRPAPGHHHVPAGRPDPRLGRLDRPGVARDAAAGSGFAGRPRPATPTHRPPRTPGKGRRLAASDPDDSPFI